MNINNILITKKKLTNYRIRKGSDCNYDKSNLILSDIPERMKYLLKYFDDFDEMRQYYNIFSWIEIAKKTLTDIQKLEKNDFLFAYNLYKIFYINFYIEAFKITYIKNDPLNYKNEIYN
ncbi:hypothetical protein OLR82_06890, partial [Campylobacter jejuni]|nr:hypothetical protein [Campylobacter jejuni]